MVSFLIAGTALLVQPAFGQSVWNGSQGSGYDNAFNWTPNGVPTSLAIFNLSGGSHAVEWFQNHSVDNLIVLGDFNFQSDTSGSTIFDYNVNTTTTLGAGSNLNIGRLNFSNSGDFIIASNAGNSELTIGSDAKCEYDSDIKIGGASLANGTLNIVDGGVLQGNTIGQGSSIGTAVDSTSFVTVAGHHGIGNVRSSWNQLGDLHVGGSGTGSLNVQDGGLVETNFAGHIGFGSGSSGEVTIQGYNSGLGVASTWTQGGLGVGNSGTGKLYVKNGGLVNTRFGVGVIGVATGSEGEVTVEGFNLDGSVRSIWRQQSAFGDFGDLQIGQSGTGTLFVRDGGFVDTQGDGYIGYDSDSIGEATVDGFNSAGNIRSEWNQGQSLTVGLAGTGRLFVKNGGRIETGERGFIGNGGEATVGGFNAIARSEWRQASSLDIAGGKLSVIEGGFVETGSQADIDDFAGSSGEGTVAGAAVINNIATASLWTQGTDLTVGENGSGKLNVNDGGTVRTGRDGFIGRLSGSAGNVTVEGRNIAAGVSSSWSVNGNLMIGTGGTGSLTVRDQGVMSVGRTMTVGTSGSVVLESNGEIYAQTVDLTDMPLGNFSHKGGFLSTNTLIADMFEMQDGVINVGHFIAPIPGLDTFFVQTDGLFQIGASPGTSTINGHYFMDGGLIEFEFEGDEAGTENDFLRVTGDLSLIGGDLLFFDHSFSSGYVPGRGEEHLIIDVGGQLSGTFASFGEGDFVGNYGSRKLFITYRAGDGNDIALFTAIPEPDSAILLLGLLGLCAVRRRWRRAR